MLFEAVSIDLLHLSAPFTSSDRSRLHPTRNHPLDLFYTHLRRCASPGLEHSNSVHITVPLQCKSLDPLRTRPSFEAASCPPEGG
jgi:hypothetical protein